MGRMTCGTCGALLVAGVIVCEHAEPLAEGLVHHGAGTTIGKEHPPDTERHRH